jgi:hypothetical protein
MDESGDLGEYGTKCFVIACLSTSNPLPVERIVKKVRERKLKKKMRAVSELKANSSSPEVRINVLNRLVRCDCRIDLIIIKKKQVRNYLFNTKNKLYNYVLGILIDEMPIRETHIELVIDKKDSNRLLREDLDQYIERKLRSKRACAKIKIKHMESHTHRALQVIDFVAWAANRKHSHDDESYYTIIEPKIGVVKGLWK